ncbi:Mevalonyl-coenzyme A hydratase sidH [Paramyrothecium foliicola]|nr:Mevalonyl-coenzyme A hydratase sidH [Paramyrothecium foliicola]
MTPKLTCQPPPVADADLSYPAPHVLLVTLNRPKQLNAMRRVTHVQLDRLWRWYDNEPSLRCAILTGSGRAFCAGADLREWDEINSAAPSAEDSDGATHANGFGGLSNRRGRKPILAAVNGLCFGGGLEMVLNCDMVLASAGARLGLPEVKRGVVAVQGALPRLVRIVGRPRATEMALLGRTYTAQQLLNWGVINHIVEGDGGQVVDEAVRWAAEMADNSPDSVLVSRAGLMGGWDAEDPKASTDRVLHGMYRGMDGADNMKEGVVSFVEKRKPVWKDSKL